MLVSAIAARRNRLLESLLARSLEQQRKLEAERLAAERGRIGMEIHDGLAGQLSSIAARLALLSRNASHLDASHIGSEIEQLQRRTARGLDDLRSIVWAFQQPARSWSQVFDYARARCAEVCDGRCHFDLQAQPSEHDVHGSTSMEIVRILEEATWNAVRHGAPTSIIARASRTDDGIQLVVEDDGSGILAPEDRGPGTGISNMQRRAHRTGGSLTVRPRAAGGGAVVSAIIREPSRTPDGAFAV